MDRSYATIPIFGEQKRVYNENHLAYMISNKDNTKNHPIYVVCTNMVSSIFHNDLCFQEGELTEGESVENEETQQPLEVEQKSECSDLDLVPQDKEDESWHMDFDGAMRKEGVGARISIIYPKGDTKILSYKLYLDYTNNVAEYETLVLGLNMLKVLKARKVSIYGDSELIID